MDINKKIDEMREDLINSTAELIKIKSLEGEAKEGMPFGEDPAKALACALDIAKRLGFKTVNLDNYVGYAEMGEGEDYVAALGHLDVVPEGEGWIYPPYGAEIHDGKMYGRGTTDDKGPIVAALFGAKAIMDLGLSTSKRIRIIFGTNEETGSKELEYYLEREKAPVAGFTPDAEYPLINGEKGLTSFDLIKEFKSSEEGDIVIESITGGQASNMVPDHCEAHLKVKDAKCIIEKLEAFAKEKSYELCAEEKDGMVVIKSKGESAHGSTPQLGKNAIMQLFAFLGTLEISNKEVSDYVKFLNDHIGMEFHGESFGVCLEDEVSGKLSFNTGVIKMDSKKSVLTLNLRYPVTKKLDDMMEPFNKTIEGTGLKVENFSHQEPLYFEPEHPLVKSLQKVYTEQTGKEAELISIGGGTYAKEMPNILAFGPMFPGDPDCIHKPNEFITLDNLVLNAKIYAHALYELAK
ncbi:dipeptidase PepV [Hathewaya massiliensis]|uniref:dipeptidase PepV n=1 Tax=Hathewaya massiliensis TaxID=1964382 RepID=UPI001157E436|nr:dipeptidase PepV [Hathewaya massiliensis]